MIRKETINHTYKYVGGRVKNNQYDLTGDYGIGWTSNTNQRFYFDLEDYDKIKNYCWSEDIDKKSGYHNLRARDRNTKKLVRFHQLLGLGYALTDHIDRNPLNNRKNNLRGATHRENARNCSKSKANTSGVTGVYYSKSGRKWQAYLTVDGEYKYLGYFADKENAIRARLKAEMKYFGEFAPQRHLLEQYGITQ